MPDTRCQIKFLELTSYFLVLISCLLPSPSRAQEGDPPISGQKPAEITAEKLEYLKDEDRFIAEGSVVVIQENLRLTADRVDLDNRTRQLHASGRVDLFDGENRLTAKELSYNLNTQEGTILQGALFVEEDHYRLQAERISKLPGDRYRLEKGSITTCDFEEGESPLWQFRVRDARVKLEHYLVARDVTFRIKDVPVFYLPYLILPVKTARQTGFLVPRVGYNTREGLKINEDFFWAIASNQDATISFDYRSARGIGGGLEYRYLLSKESGGTLETHYFNDRLAERQRVESELHHRQVFTPDLEARLNVHLVNDIGQFQDLSEITDERVRKTLESGFILYRRWDNHYLYLLARYTQDLLTEDDFTLQQLPELGYRLQAYRIGALPLYFEVEAQATYFWREEELLVPGAPEENKIRAERLDLFPRLEGRINLSGMVVTPRAGFRETWYSRSLSSDSAVHRDLPIFDVGVHTRLSRSYPISNVSRITHSLAPAVVYEYVSEEDQSDLPKFDEVDELQRKNLLTYSLTNRLVGHFRKNPPEAENETPQRLELVMLKLTQSYDVREKRRQNEQGPSRPFSDLRGEISIHPLSFAQLEMDGFYDFYERETVSLNTDLKIRLRPYVLLSVGQRYTR
ncbi:MAG TPA: LPS assembly protein LptD [Nitrospiria bacterium]|nr:LPS assembly protein LptD [Nitrospiria bacterium]